jgi:hypothetical protein
MEQLHNIMHATAVDTVRSKAARYLGFQAVVRHGC